MVPTSDDGKDVGGPIAIGERPRDPAGGLERRFQGYLVVQLALSVVAIAMLVFGEFGGYYYRTYPGVDVWGSVYLGSGILSTVLVLAGVLGLAVAGRAALRGLRDDDITDSELGEEEARAMRAAVATAGLAAVGALAVIASNLGNDWWLGAGFYGAFVGGLLVAGLAYLVRADLGVATRER